jgi:Sorting nexin C terminal
VGKYVVESFIVSLMQKIQDLMWPSGTLKRGGVPRTAKEKAKTKRDASFKLAVIFEGPTPSVW